MVGEAKDRAALNIHETVAKAEDKAGHMMAFVWWKRTERKEGNERRTQVGRPVVCMSEEAWLYLLSFVRTAINYEKMGAG